MPGYELIDNQEFEQVSEIFKKAKLYLGWVLIKQEKIFFKVEDFENNFTKN